MNENENEQNEEVVSKEQRMIDYAKSLDEIEKSIEPFREHKKDLKTSYLENNWLTKEEMSLVLKAYRSIKKEEDLLEIDHYVSVLRKGM